MTRSDRRRVAAALAASLLAHVALLSFLRLPPEQPALPAGSRLNLLLIPVPGERRAESAQSASSSPVAPTATEAARLGERQRKAVAAAPPPAEQRRQRQPWVSASPMSVPQAQPESLLADAQGYLPPDAVSLHPQFATPFVMSYPRRAFEEGRRAVVVVQLMIDENGRVIEATATADAPEDFAQAAVAALRLARFTPAQAGGRPVKARAYFAVSFVIE